MAHAHALKSKTPATGSRGFRGVLVTLGAGVAMAAGLAAGEALKTRRAEPLASPAANLQIAKLTAELDLVKGSLVVNELKLERLTKVVQYSSFYRIPADVAGRIYDAALAEGIHPSLGYQLVKVESQFKARARSPRGALGYTQVKLETARDHDARITERDLLNPEVNLRIGFRILKQLLVRFDHDLEMALRAYNLGPTGAVLSMSDTSAMAPGAEYAGKVMRGVKRGR